DEPLHRDAGFLQDLDDTLGRREVRAVQRDRAADLCGGESGRPVDDRVALGGAGFGGGDLDEADADAGSVYALGQFVHDAAGQLVDRPAGIFRRDQALVDAGRADDVETGPPGDMAKQQDVATDAEVRPFDHQIDALGAQFVGRIDAGAQRHRPVDIHVGRVGRAVEIDI